MANVVAVTLLLFIGFLAALWLVRYLLFSRIGLRLGHLLLSNRFAPLHVYDNGSANREASNSDGAVLEQADTPVSVNGPVEINDSNGSYSQDTAPNGADDAGQAYPVKYLSERSSHSLLRLVPWDASGTLSETDNGFRFSGSSLAGEPMEMTFSSEEARINYQRGNLLWDGGVSWCVIEVNGEKHYFTSDLPNTEEEPPPGNEVSTTVMYRSLTNRYIRGS